MFRRRKKKQQQKEDFDEKNLIVRLKKAKKKHLITKCAREIKFRILSTRILKSLLFLYQTQHMTKP